MRRYAWVIWPTPISRSAHRPDSAAKTVACPAYLESHGIPKTPEELIDHACLMHGTESWRFVSGTSAAG